MPRIRSIHPDACDSEKLAALSDSAERTLWRLITLTDDDGRGEDRPKLLAAKLYPLVDDKTADDLDRDLGELDEVGLIVRYQVEDRRYYAIPTFGDWQSPRHPRPSKYPPPPAITADRRNGTANRRHAPAGEEVGSGSGSGEVNPSSTDVDTDDRFDEFWDAWPPRNGKKLNKPKAHQQWRSKVKPAERDAAITGAHHYRTASDSGLAGAMDAFRWLRDRAWPDWQDPAAPPATRANGNRAGPAPPAPRNADYLAGFYPPDDPRAQERTA